ncbi:MAG: acetate uptake transporter [Methanobacterium sp.]|uniref:acetate uptake transporter n=1 Tax=Methanobacterium sp. TaxID=2164 RepID=UPI003D64E98C|nr:acetate uptake transporter [Methanobacterium sp.]
MTEKNEDGSVIIRDMTANPAPLGLIAFGLTTVLLNFANAGFFPVNSMILAMGIAYGGTAQVIACAMEYKKGNTFATVAFGSFGLFWWSLVLLLILPKLGLADKTDPMAMAAYLIMWGIFTLGMFVGTLKLNRGLQVVFATLTILFFLLAIGDITGSLAIKTIAGYEGILTGASAIYVGLAEVINEVYGRKVLPI